MGRESGLSERFKAEYPAQSLDITPEAQGDLTPLILTLQMPGVKIGKLISWLAVVNSDTSGHWYAGQTGM